jgi:hypothetical protein
VNSRFLSLLALVLLAATARAAPAGGALAGDRPRVLVSTDVGGTDPDDFQSLVHLLLYADVLDIEGLVSSPWGPGRRGHILQVIDLYAADYPRLKTHSDRYPSPDELRRVTRQGAFDAALGRGVGRSTDGSDWIVRCAKRDDPRPLWVLVWGTLDDLAQALHDDPSIAPRLRVYAIAGPNKKWGLAAYDYIVENHPDLWMIESNDTYRGWFTGGDQEGDLGNETFVSRQARGAGALGEFFASLLGGRMKMGDTPSVAYLLRGTPEDPTRPSWGGRYVRAWPLERLVVRGRPARASDVVEQFGILELVPAPLVARPERLAAALVVDEQEFPASIDDASGTVRFRFMPKDVKRWTYRIKSNAPALDGQAGEFTSVKPSPSRTDESNSRLSHWWTDDPSPEWAEGPHPGARTVSQWRADFLGHFARRLDRCRAPTSAPSPPSGGKDPAPRLMVTENRRYLQYADGKPFLYLADTAWELFHRLNREEAAQYLANRAHKGFTVIQAVVLAQLGGLTVPNPYGDVPLIDGDPARPNEAYFRHVDFVVSKAEGLGLFVGMLPTWGSYRASGNSVFTPAGARQYGRFLGRRYKDRSIVWVLGGDRSIANPEERAIIDAIAAGLGEGDGGAHLKTFHPIGPGFSSLPLHRAPWLDFDMFQSSHAARDHDKGPYVEHDYALTPAKPSLDGEPRYEGIPVGFYNRGASGIERFDNYDTRQAAWWSLLAGACGHTYGSNNVWQTFRPGVAGPDAAARRDLFGGPGGNIGANVPWPEAGFPVPGGRPAR